jgi:molybdopterin-guanine dinucleotide biosynthesis protein A
MGQNKALLPHPNNQAVTFVEHLVSLLADCCVKTLIVARDQAQTSAYAFPGVHVTHDKTPDIGPLMGLYSGLNAIDTERALVVAVDMPFVQPTLLSFLLSIPLKAGNVLIPVVHGVPQVMLAIYPCSVLPFITEQLRRGRRDLRCLLEVAPVQFVEEAQVLEIDPQLRSFFNINTPEEFGTFLHSGPSLW